MRTKEMENPLGLVLQVFETYEVPFDILLSTRMFYGP